MRLCYYTIFLTQPVTILLKNVLLVIFLFNNYWNFFVKEENGLNESSQFFSNIFIRPFLYCFKERRFWGSNNSIMWERGGRPNGSWKKIWKVWKTLVMRWGVIVICGCHENEWLGTTTWLSEWVAPSHWCLVCLAVEPLLRTQHNTLLLVGPPKNKHKYIFFIGLNVNLVIQFGVF